MPIRSRSFPAPGRSALLSDLATSLLTQAAVVAGNLITLRLAAQAMDPANVGELVLVRRVLVFVSPLLLIGLGVGLPRSIGKLHGKPEQAGAFIVAGWLLGAGAMVLASLVCGLVPGHVSLLLFGTQETVTLVAALGMLLVGNEIFMLTYATLRGMLRIQRANLLQLAQVAVLPPAIIATLGRHGAASALRGLGVSSIIVSGACAFLMLRSSIRGFSWRQLRPALHELCAYGLPRVPGDFAVAGLYALPAILAAHSLDLQAAGTLAISMSFITVLSAAFGPVGLVLLPRLSSVLARRGDAPVRAHLPLMLAIAGYGAAFMVIVGSVFGNDWLRFVLGPQYVIDDVSLVLLMLAGGGNIFFVVLRSVLDASYFRPLNSIHAFVALGMLVLGWRLFLAWHRVPALVAINSATAASLVVLGALTILAVARRFRVRSSGAAAGRWLLTQALLLATCLGMRALVSGWTWALFAASQAVILMAWIVIMYASGVRWSAQVRSLMRRPVVTIHAEVVAPPACVTAPAGRARVLAETEAEEEAVREGHF